MLRQVPGPRHYRKRRRGQPDLCAVACAQKRGRRWCLSTMCVSAIAAGTGGEMDMSNISPDDIQRIEVLRGPQSAFMARMRWRRLSTSSPSVEHARRRSGVTMEAGSYGTIAARAFTSGATDTTSWAFLDQQSSQRWFLAIWLSNRKNYFDLAGPHESDSTIVLAAAHE